MIFARWALAFLLGNLAAGSPAQTVEPQLVAVSAPFGQCTYAENRGETGSGPAFEICGRFSEGLAQVRIEGRFGYVDRDLRVVIEPRFQSAGPFRQGRAEIILDGKAGIIDREGRFVVEPAFARIIPFTGDTFIARALVAGQVSGDLPTWLPGLDRLELSGVHGGLFDPAKGWLTGQGLEFNFFDEAERGLIWARSVAVDPETWGLLRADGTWQVTPRYSHTQSISEGRAVVRDATGASGAVDADGVLVIPATFQWLGYWRGGYGWAKRDGREAIVRPDGTLLAGQYFEKVEISDEGLLPRVRIGGLWRSVGPDGTIIDDDRGAVLFECPGGFRFRQHARGIEISHAGHARPIGVYDDTYFGQRSCGTALSVRRDGKWGFILADGTPLPATPEFDNTYGFGGERSFVQQSGLWGIIDDKGQFIVPPTWSELSGSGDIWRAKLGSETVLIDRNGNPTVEPRPDHTLALNCGDRVKFFTENGLWGLRDAGRIMIPARYRALSCFGSGVSYAVKPGAKAWCPLGSDGEDRDAPPCLDTYYSITASHSWPEAFAEDPFESSVSWNRAMLNYGIGKRAEPPQWRRRFDPAPGSGPYPTEED